MATSVVNKTLDIFSTLESIRFIDSAFQKKITWLCVNLPELEVTSCCRFRLPRVIEMAGHHPVHGQFYGILLPDR